MLGDLKFLRAYDYTLLNLPRDNPDLVQAKLAAFTRQVPIMYALVMVNTVALAITHMDTAPALLTVAIPALLSAVCIVRMILWWRSQGKLVSHEAAIARLRSTIATAGLLGAGFSAWSLSLFPYGDAYAQSHVAFFMAVTTIGVSFCLMQLRSAVLLIMALVTIPFAIFFVSTGSVVFIAYAVNFVMVVFVVSYVMLVNHRDFANNIASTKALLAKQDELRDLNDTNFRNSNSDSLTGLPNRRNFFAELDRRMARAGGAGNSLVVGILDLDGFKPINDVHGHSAGDRLLVEVGRRLRTELDASVYLARLGGDEFVIIDENNASRDRIMTTGKAITDLLQAPFQIDELTIRIGCSIGFAMFPCAATTATDLFECADYALYFVKQHDRGNTMIFSAEHQATIREASLIDQALLNANLERELWIAYQPIIDLDRSRPVGFEALARWRSPTLGDVPPIRFITAAERSGSIGQLTVILLRKALEGAASWPEDVRISFNLSALDVASPLSVLKIVSIVEQSGIDATRIDFEVTETALMRNRSQASDALKTLKALGARISLDDFGTGYSSFGCIRELPLDKIKIDRSFIQNIETDAASLMILKTLVGLCSSLLLDCIVEGVETPRQAQLLRDEGCRFMQGYHFARPMPGDRVAGYLAACGKPSEQAASCG
ncbi:EAL domain-containing protein [soil metagenome]